MALLTPPPPMPPPPSPLQHRELRVLHLEDSELDHELMLAHLRRDGLRIHARRVETEAEFHRALDEPWTGLAQLAGATVFIVAVTRGFWRFALRRYSSASS